MKLVRYLFCLVTFLAACNCQVTRDSQKIYETPFFSLTLPVNWEGYPKTEFSKLADSYSDWVGDVSVSFIGLSNIDSATEHIVIRHKPLSGSFAAVAMALKKDYPVQYRLWQNYNLRQVKDITIGGQPALWFSSSYTKVVSDKDQDGHVTAVMGHDKLFEEIFIGWPENGVLVLQCEQPVAAADRHLCVRVAENMLLKQPPLNEKIISSGSYKSADDLLVVPEKWYLLTSEMTYDDYIQLPEKVRFFYESRKNINLIEPAGNVALIVEKIAFNDTIDDEKELHLYAEKIAQRFEEKISVQPQHLEFFRNGIPRIVFGPIKISEQKPYIFNKLYYLLNGSDSRFINCKYFAENQADAERSCEQIVDSFEFQNAPHINPRYEFIDNVSGKTVTGMVAFDIPEGWQLQENTVENTVESQLVAPAVNGQILNRIIIKSQPAGKDRQTTIKTMFSTALANLERTGKLTVGDPEISQINGYSWHLLSAALAIPMADGSANTVHYETAVLVTAEELAFFQLISHDAADWPAKKAAFRQFLASVVVKTNIKMLAAEQRQRDFSDDYITLRAPRYWYLLDRRAANHIKTLPSPVISQYNVNNDLQLINGNLPENVTSERINISFMNGFLPLNDNSMQGLAVEVKKAFMGTFNNVELVKKEAISGDSGVGYSLLWKYDEPQSGAAITSEQFFMNCRDKTVILTCIYQDNLSKDARRNCLETISTVRCK